MKTTNRYTTGLAGVALILGLVGMAALPATGTAQETGSAKGGAAKLMQLKPLKTVADADAVKPGDTVVMSCPKCKNSWVTIVQPSPKTGAKPHEITTLRHECPGCEHKLVREGQGKAATQKLVHTCKNCGSEDAFCCVMKKGEGPTPGMERK